MQKWPENHLSRENHWNAHIAVTKHLCKRVTLQIIKEIHSEEKPFCCSKCGEKFKPNGDLKVHELTPGGDVQILLEINTPVKYCRECGGKFAESELEHHELTHTGGTGKVCVVRLQKVVLFRSL